MITPPSIIDGAKVLMVADLSRTLPTGRTRHFVAGRHITDFCGLAITKYEREQGVCLFYCDEYWETVTDTYHDTVEAAMEQARFEFGPLDFVDPASVDGE